MCGRHVWLQFQFELWVHRVQKVSRESFQIDFAVIIRIGHQSHELYKVLLTLTRPQIDTQPRRIKAGTIGNPGIRHRLCGGANRESNVASGIRKSIGVRDKGVKVESANFGRKSGWEICRLKMRDSSNTAASVLQCLPEILNVVAQRCDTPDSCHNHSTFHSSSLYKNCGPASCRRRSCGG